MTTPIESDKIVLVSGGFDPLHIGHVQMIEHATHFGNVVVVINSDEWLARKKGYVFMPLRERIFIMQHLKHVHAIYSMYAFDGKDDDGTVIKAIELIKPDYFANGGDRTKKNVPEQAICDELGVEMLWGVGGEDKPQSSSWLVNKAMEQLRGSDHGN